MDQLAILERLTAVIESRKGEDPGSSYVARLLAKGRLKMAQKVGEEGVEVAIAAAAGSRDDMVSESADLLFHLMVLLASEGLSLTEVAAALAEREGLSGLEEKASRHD